MISLLVVLQYSIQRVELPAKKRPKDSTTNPIHLVPVVVYLSLGTDRTLLLPRRRLQLKMEWR